MVRPATVSATTYVPETSGVKVGNCDVAPVSVAFDPAAPEVSSVQLQVACGAGGVPIGKRGPLPCNQTGMPAGTMRRPVVGRVASTATAVVVESPLASVTTSWKAYAVAWSGSMARASKRAFAIAVGPMEVAKSCVVKPSAAVPAPVSVAAGPAVCVHA